MYPSHWKITENMNKWYYISLGSNMGSREEHLANALIRMKAHGIDVGSRSQIYETQPWGKTDQASFLNAVVQIFWDGAAEDLMTVLLAIEREEGRTRDIHWGPRTLDLDLIWGQESCHSPHLTLPHPYFWERAFVLVPLSDIAPDFVYQGEKIKDRIEALHGELDVKLWKGGLWIE